MKKIQQAVNLARQSAETAIYRGMVELLDWGVERCLDAHRGDPLHHEHLNMGDSYGWALVHNGKEIGRRLWVQGAESESNANEQLNEKVAAANPQGWVGIVLAGMKAYGYNYFNITFEKGFMNTAINELKSADFDRYFKPIE